MIVSPWMKSSSTISTPLSVDMSTRTDIDIDVELRTILRSGPGTGLSDFTPGESIAGEQAPANAASSIPDGGYGWTLVSICSLFTFWFNGIMGSWGVLQAALLRSQLTSTSTSTISFVGTL